MQISDLKEFQPNKQELTKCVFYTRPLLLCIFSAPAIFAYLFLFKEYDFIKLIHPNNKLLFANLSFNKILNSFYTVVTKINYLRLCSFFEI